MVTSTGSGSVRRGIGRALLWAACVSPAHAADSASWLQLVTTAPPPAASLEDARAGVRAQRQGAALAVTAADPRWRQRAQAAEALIAPMAAATAAEFRSAMQRFNADPQAARWVDGLGKALDDAERAARRGEHGPIRSPDPQVQRLLEDVDKPVAPGRVGPIGTFLGEHRRAQPNVNTLRQRQFELRHRFARLHAAEDATASSDTNGRWSRHQHLARQQLVQAQALHADARAVLLPAAQSLAVLAGEAEQRGAPAGERMQAYQWFKAAAELLDTIARTAIEDAGFWAQVQPVPAEPASACGWPQAPDLDLRCDGVLPPQGVPYPRGRVAATSP
jgi:hypothetical protein